jgi:hypothetical protein
MFGVSIYMIFMGGYYDRLTQQHLPAGVILSNAMAASSGSTAANQLADAKNMAGIDLLHVTLVIPIVLIVAFGGLVLYMRSRKKVAVMAA